MMKRSISGFTPGATYWPNEKHQVYRKIPYRAIPRLDEPSNETEARAELQKAKETKMKRFDEEMLDDEPGPATTEWMALFEPKPAPPEAARTVANRQCDLSTAAGFGSTPKRSVDCSGRDLA
jgi:hypothetical protein